MKLCKKLLEMHSAMTEWQQTTWYPDCEDYNLGTCVNPTRADSTAPCPFDVSPLPLLEVPVEPIGEPPRHPSFVASSKEPGNRPGSRAVEQAIKDEIVKRTGGRIQMLEVETMDNGIVIRGRAPCYYLKQLALQGVLDVIGTAGDHRIKLDVEVKG
jgi:hypothetical protein